MEKAKTIGIWVAIVLAAVGFGGAGTAKLMGVEMVHMSFANMGLPVWFGYFIGAAELIGGLALLYPRLSSPAATGLFIIGLGAIGYHIAFPPVSAGIAAFVLTLLVLWIMVTRRSRSLWFSGTVNA